MVRKLGKFKDNTQGDGRDQLPASSLPSGRGTFDASQHSTGIGGHPGDGNPDSLSVSLRPAIKTSKRVLGSKTAGDNKIAKTDQQPESRPSSPHITSIAELAKMDMLDDRFLETWESFVLPKKKPSDHSATMQHPELGESSRPQERVQEKALIIEKIGEYIQDSRSSMTVIEHFHREHGGTFYKKGGFAYALFDRTKDILLKLSDDLRQFDIISEKTRKSIEKFKTNRGRFPTQKSRAFRAKVVSIIPEIVPLSS